MKAVLKVLKQQGLFFVDSSTYSKSIGDQVARSMGVPTARNNIFLDNSSDEDDIIAKIWQAVEMADRNGSAIAICNARPHTAAAWSKNILTLLRRNYFGLWDWQALKDMQRGGL